MKRGPQRISMTLSQEAYSVIELDMEIFQNETNLDGFINTIINNFKDDSDASISLAKEREHEKYTNWIKTISGANKITADDLACIDRLTEGYAYDLQTKMNSFNNGIPLKPRINNKNYDSLKMGQPDFQEEEFYPREGKYIKAILEVYAQLPFIERESIYYKEVIDDINAAISLGNILTFEYTNRKQQCSRIKVRPYKIASSSLLPFNYLLAIPLNAKSIEDTHPYRISRIAHPERLSRTSHITREEKNQIEKWIQSKGGIQYLSSTDSEITIALSEQGYILFKSILHLRPKYISKIHEGDKWILTFRCAEEQIKNYFFQFAQDAIILTPAHLKKWFQTKYDQASLAYRADN